MTHLSVRLADTARHVAPATPSKITTPLKTQSFANQLSHAVAQTASSVVTDSQTAQGLVAGTSRQTASARQNSVAADLPSVAAPLGFNALIPRNANPATSTQEAAPAAATATQSVNDAYWAKQPAAVQQLRKIDDAGQRAMLAAQLAAEGYAIDTPVMVWGWDASKTTQLRQGFGYTWVPFAMQAPVSAAPDITGGGIVPYDPAHPPAGSILV